MNGTSRRAWVKNAAIVFLIVLLLLTFFSNTILNYSLPEVSVQYASYDSITNAIKVSGTVKANESYVVTYDEADKDSNTTEVGQTRKIVSVYVKQGTVVAIGDPIIALKGGASKELEEAEKSLRDLEKQYALDKITDTINDLTSDKSKTENERQLADYYKQLGNKKELYEKLLAGTDPTETLKAQKKAQEKEVAAIQKQIDEINTRITEIKGKISTAEGNIEEDYSGKTLTERYNEAKQNYEVLKGEYDTLTARVKELKNAYEKLTDVTGDVAKAYEISKTIKDLRTQYDDTFLSLRRSIEDYVEKYKDDITENEQEIIDLKNAESISKELVEKTYQVSVYADISMYRHTAQSFTIISFIGNDGTTKYVLLKEYSERRNIEDTCSKLDDILVSLSDARAKLSYLGYSEIDDFSDFVVSNEAEQAKKAYDNANAELTEVTTDYENAKKEYESLQKQMNSTGTISDNKVLLETFTRDLQSYTDKKEAADEILKDIEEDLQAAQTENNKKPEEVEDEITKLQNDITTLEKQMKIDSATESKNDVESKYTREDQVKQIEELKEKIEKIKAAPEETLVTAPIAGKIVSIDFVPGNSITSGAEVARIEVADKGYICEVSMTTEQARKVQIGAECSIVNSWWFSDVKASVSQIRSDPQSQGQKKIVVITVTGDVSEGQTLNFSIGDRSQSYESVLPKTALREDKEGKFVLVVESKSTPLGVRYKAVRYNVEVVASDDTKCAVSGLYGNESIITTSTSPISDGQQVRLAEN
mgnify:CR=1 FL=1